VTGGAANAEGLPASVRLVPGAQPAVRPERRSR
jgi:hypothetical protein